MISFSFSPSFLFFITFNYFIFKFQFIKYSKS